MKRCFVISPIGEEGSEIREHADDVFEFIIKPAMDEVGLVAHRADHTNEVGRITEQMYRSILNDDLRIAILTFRNPNVFYELAVAQCAARPTILMMAKGSPLPFDVSDMRAVEYDLKPRPIRDKVYHRKLVEHVKGLEAAKWRVEVPFGTGLSPLGGAAREVRPFPKAEHFGNSEAWIGLLRSTRKQFLACGISLHAWTRYAGFKEALVEKAAEGCEMRFLLMDAANPALPAYMNDEHSIDRTREGINRTVDYLRRAAGAHPNFQLRRVAQGCMHQQIVITDDRAIVIPYLFARATSQSPLLEIDPSSPLVKVMRDEFDALWAANAAGQGVSGSDLESRTSQA